MLHLSSTPCTNDKDLVLPADIFDDFTLLVSTDKVISSALLPEHLWWFRPQHKVSLAMGLPLRASRAADLAKWVMKPMVEAMLDGESLSRQVMELVSLIGLLF